MFKKITLLTVGLILFVQVAFYVNQILSREYVNKKQELNFDISSQIILNKDIELSLDNILKDYDYDIWQEEDVLINKRTNDYKITVYPYYPEQYPYSESTVYITPTFKRMNDVETITIRDHEYTDIHYLSEEDFFMNELSIYIPYTSFTDSQYDCYFIDLENANLDTLSELSVGNPFSVSSIAQNQFKLKEYYNTVQLFKNILIIVVSVVSIFILYQLVLAIKDLDLTLRLFGLSVLKLYTLKLIVFSIMFAALSFIFQTWSRYTFYFYLLDSICYILIDYGINSRKTISDIIRSKTKKKN